MSTIEERKFPTLLFISLTYIIGNWLFKSNIVDILAFAWKIRQDTVKETVEKAGPTNQTNVQINSPGFGGENYNHLLTKLNLIEILKLNFFSHK